MNWYHYMCWLAGVCSVLYLRLHCTTVPQLEHFSSKSELSASEFTTHGHACEMIKLFQEIEG